MKNLSGNVKGWVETKKETAENETVICDKELAKKLAKSGKSELKKLAKTFNDLYKAEPKKEYYDILTNIYSLEKMCSEI